MTGTIVLAVIALVGWVVAGVMWRAWYLLRRTHDALDAGVVELQRMFDDATDEARRYREENKVQNIHIAFLESKEGKE